MTDIAHNFLRLYTTKSSAQAIHKLRDEKVAKVVEKMDENLEIARKRREEQERLEDIHPGLYDAEFKEKEELERIKELQIQELLNFSPDTEGLNLKIQLKGLAVV